MLFPSYEFLIFLAIVFPLYWSIRNLKAQNFLVVVASYFFYGWWDWRFLSLIFFSTLLDYFLGQKIHRTEDIRARKRWLWLSVGLNLTFLGFFKYFNFFVDSFAVLLESMGFHANMPLLRIVLPVGISFYTFQSLSYTIDIYRKQLEPTKDITAFFAFVSFFPQLVAGPIERAQNLLPQFHLKRHFDPAAATDGLRQMLWGFFKKVVIADTCAVLVDLAFTPGNSLSWESHVIGVILFAVQIYCDFSGYSDIAIGLARLFGFRLMQNFAYPYFSRSIPEFWRRWHISLSTWFRDYVYIPLGGSNGSTALRARNILITFTLSGLWHGANWTYVFWGLLNGLYYIPHLLMRSVRSTGEIIAANRMLPSMKELFQVLMTFLLICMAWVFFRAESMEHGLEYFERMFGISDGEGWIFARRGVHQWILFVGVILLFSVEWIQRNFAHGLERMPASRPLRWLIYFLLAFVVINFFGVPKTFVYFQF